MNISRFFIDRPIFAAVLSIIIFVGGLISIFQLPISEYPDVVPPSVVVHAQFPGANPTVIAETVATPLEEQINGVDNMLYMSSQATADGSLQLTVTFKIGTNVEQAETDVQNRVQRALPRLPDEVRQIGVTTIKSSPDLTMVVHLKSPNERYDEVYLRNYAVLNVKDRLARIRGMGQVQLFGAGDYAMRIWLDPQKLAARNLTAPDVVAAIREQNVQVAAGVVGASPTKDAQFQLSVNTLGRLSTEEQFGDIIVKAGGLDDPGAVTRLRDVARIEMGASEYALRSLLDNKPAVAIPLFAAPGANALQLSTDVRATMEELKKDFPDGVDYSIVYDPTQFVRSSIHAVVETLLEAVALVVLVVIVFLQTWRASIIPLIAVPISIVGTFAVMLASGFSINTLSLFGLVLAIGIVVDDSIVVVENVERNIEGGLSPHDATIQAMKEVSGPIVAIALVLCAVFVPIAFVSGLTGQFYRQFALTIAISTIISAVNSLTLSPALAATLLRPHDAKKDPLSRVMDRLFGGFFRRFNRVFARGSHGYERGVGGVLKRKSAAMVVYALLIVAAFFVFRSVPNGFVPSQDKQYLVGFAQLPDAASLDRTEDVIRRMSDIGLKTAGVESSVAFPGLSINGFTNAPNAGIVFFTLKSFDERRGKGLSGPEIAMKINQQLGAIGDAIIMVFPPPPVNGLGTIGGFKLFVQDRGNVGYDELYKAVGAVQAKARATPELAGVFSSYQINVPQLFADVDRTKAKQLGVPLGDIFSTMQIDLGSLYVNDFNKFGRTYQVIVQADAPFRSQVEGIEAAEGAQREGRDGAAVEPDDGARQLRTRPRAALQRIRVRRHQRRRGARRVERAGAGRDGEGARRDAAEGRRLRVDRPDVPGHPVRQHDADGLPDLRAARVPRARRAVRELDAAARGDPDRADVDPVRADRRQADRRRQQHLHADRAVRARRPRVEERDPDRRVRARPRARRTLDRRRGARGVPAAAAADPDDVDRIHHGRAASRLLARRRRRDASCDGRRRLRRHARRDVLRPVPDAGVLRAAAPAREPLRRRGAEGAFIDRHRRSEGMNATIASIRAGALLAAALVVGGCAAPDLRQPEVATPDAFKEASAPVPEGSWKPAQPAEAAPRGAWWLAFGDASLSALEDEAVVANPDVAAAAARVAQARALLRVAEADRSPQLDLGAGGERGRYSSVQAALPGGTAAPTFNAFSLLGSASYEVDVFGRVRNNVRATRADADASTALYRSVLLALQADVAQTYFRVRESDAELDVLRQTLRLREDDVRLTTSRFNAGDISEVDVTRAKTERATTEADMIGLERQRATAEHALAVLLGRAPAGFDFGVNPLVDVTNLPAIPAGLPSSLLERRPDIAAAQQQMIAANARIGVARSAIFPAVALTGQGGAESYQLSDLFKWSSTTWLIGAALSLPIVDGGRNRANIRRAESALDESVANYRKQVLAAFADVEDDLVGLRTLGGQARATDEAVASARRAAQLADRRYREGQTGYLESIDAQRQLLAVERQAVQLRGEQATTTVALIRALGGGWGPVDASAPVASSR